MLSIVSVPMIDRKSDVLATAQFDVTGAQFKLFEMYSLDGASKFLKYKNFYYVVYSTRSLRINFFLIFMAFGEFLKIY